MNETLNIKELKEIHLNLKRRLDKIYRVDFESPSLSAKTNNENFKANLQHEQLSSKTQHCTGNITNIYLLL